MPFVEVAVRSDTGEHLYDTGPYDIGRYDVPVDFSEQTITSTSMTEQTISSS